MFLVLEVGQAIIELRLEQQRLPQEPCYAERTAWRRAIRPMGRALIRLFLQPGPSNRQRALHAVNQAIMAGTGGAGAARRSSIPRRCDGAQLPALHSQRPARPAIAPWPGKKPVSWSQSRGAEGHRILLPIRTRFLS